MADESSVRVALRIRPQISRERIEGSKSCTRCTPGVPQVWIGDAHAFTYDYVFDTDSTQERIYETVHGLVDGCLDGYNATILAYGQTGSGKTYTMGTGFDVEARRASGVSDTQGIIPRAVHHIFNSIHERREAALKAGEPLPDFKVCAQFVELYNEEVFDLIDNGGNKTQAKFSQPSPSPRSFASSSPSVAKSASVDNLTQSVPIPIQASKSKNGNYPSLIPSPVIHITKPSTVVSHSPGHSKSSDPSRQSILVPYTTPASARKGTLQIREDSTGAIYLVGVGSKPVASAEEAMQCLYDGALSRTTASTNMNDESSRSHAIFTLHIKQQRMITSKDDAMDTGVISDYETLSAKFHFVDLAGSERLKRTGAVGDRAKESISINSGLLSLGNVISALGDKTKKASHVPYRDSKLTRLLQDSLGGNSRTMMLACVSPSEKDFLETLNTLKYANRARNIKNKVTVNQDKNSTLIALLRNQIRELEDELQDYKQGKRVMTANGEEQETDTSRECILLQTEIQNLTSRLKALQGTVDSLNAKNSQLLAEKATGTWMLKDNDSNGDYDLTKMVQKYIQEIEELSSKLFESEATCEHLRKKIELNLNNSLSPRHRTPVTRSGYPLSDDEIDEPVSALIEVAKKELENDRLQAKKLENGHKNRNPIPVDDELMDEDLSSEETEETETSDETADEANYNAELAHLTTEIGTKQRLIEQLELSQKRLEGMRAQYEEKLICLTQRIKVTQEERDKVLANMSKQNNAPQGKQKQVKDDYEKKIAGLQTELKKWQSANKKHQEMLRSQAQHAKQVETLRSEVENMKRAKVRLMNQVKEENARRRDIEFQRNKEIAQLKKSQRLKDNAIRTLETENRRKEQVLKRKHEEVTALKKISKSNMSKKAAGQLKFSPVKAKTKWTALRSTMIRTSSNKQTVENLEKEMLQDIAERTQLMGELEDLNREKQNGMYAPSELNNINDNIDTITSTVSFLDEKIKESQKNILELTAGKDEAGTSLMSTLVSGLNREECGYLLEKMYQQSLDDLILSSQQAKLNTILEQDIKHLTSELGLLRELLMHMYNKTMTYDDLPEDYVIKLQSIRSGMIPAYGLGYDLSGDSEKNGHHPPEEPSKVVTRKARRLTCTPSELLGSPPLDDNAENVFINPNDFPNLASLNRVSSIRGSTRMQRRGTYSIADASRNAPEVVPTTTNRRTTTIKDSASATSITNGNDAGHISSQPNLNTTFVLRPLKAELDTTFLDGNSPNTTPPGSPSLSRKNSAHKTPPGSPIRKNPSSTSTTQKSPPGSPTSSRKNLPQNDNVFQRLTSSMLSAGETSVSNGKIRPVREKPGVSNPLTQTHVASGHKKAVLSVFATQDTLFTGSKDTTVKVWDLNTGVELQTLSGHPCSVNCVRYVEDIHCILTVSSCYIKAWDSRMNTCFKTLLSAGTYVDGPMSFDPNSPNNELPNGEHNIQDIVVSNSFGLYTTYGEKVRIWDLRYYRPIGLLGGKHHSSQIKCMATQAVDNKEMLITGSKDHYIKLYDFDSIEPTSNIGVAERATLQPPHYDGIESLAVSNSTLFSASRDMCIKKWDLSTADPTLVQSLNRTHGNWISGLTFAPSDDNKLISASKDGSLKLWSSENCALLGSAQASKQGVNCVSRNSSHLFTGSQEGNVGFWTVSDPATASST